MGRSGHLGDKGRGRLRDLGGTSQPRLQADHRQTFERYLMMQRVEAAKRMRLEPLAMISEVAEKCGFADSAYFVRVLAASDFIARRLRGTVFTGAGFPPDDLTSLFTASASSSTRAARRCTSFCV